MLKEVIEKIKKATEPKIKESFNNQFQRLVKIKESYWEDVEKYFGGANYDEYQRHDYNSRILGLTKGAYREMMDYNSSQLAELYEKKANKYLLALSEKITSKVMKKEDKINSIKLLNFWGNSGSWLINGKKIFSFDTILAGGYNIQCLHVRVIFKYK